MTDTCIISIALSLSLTTIDSEGLFSPSLIIVSLLALFCSNIFLYTFYNNFFVYFACCRSSSSFVCSYDAGLYESYLYVLAIERFHR